MNTQPVQLTPGGLNRRIRRHLHAKAQKFYAVCTPGFESVCAGEISDLRGTSAVEMESGGVSFVGGFDSVYLANLGLRTAQRILLRIDEFLAPSYPELFNKCKRIAWERYTGFANSVSIHASSRNSRLHHTDRIAETVVNAVSETMTPLAAPVTLSNDSSLQLYVRFARDRCTLSVDSSGVILHKRGYRTLTGTAPLRETTAAAILLDSDLPIYDMIVDPFCGSGTFLVEAAFILTNRAPGLNRSFAFEQWPSFEPNTWKHLCAQAQAQIQTSAKPVLAGGDSDPGAVALAGAIAAANAPIPISYACGDASVALFDSGMRGLVCSNLPYGKRAGTATNLRELYRTFGRNLAQQATGWHYALVVPDAPGVWKLLGLRPERITKFSNGGLDAAVGYGKIRQKNEQQDVGAVPEVHRVHGKASNSASRLK